MIDINLSRKVNGIGRHDQIIHFDNGEKKYIQGVIWMWESQFVHLVDYLGVEYIINGSKVNFVERFSRGGEGHAEAKNKGRKRKVRVRPT